MSGKEPKKNPPGIESLIVSACLIGTNCCYDGKNRKNEAVIKFCKNFNTIEICPEVMAGLPVPRLRSEIKGGDGKDVLNKKAKVLNETGEDVTKYFLRGAELTLNLVKKNNVKLALLKARSPSCGKDWIYDGSFSGKLKRGNGVASFLLKKNGVKIFNEDEIENIKKGGLSD